MRHSHNYLPIIRTDSDQRTALHLACSEGRLNVVELLVCEGADVNVNDRWGNKPIDDAKLAKKNSKQIVSLLKAKGALSSKFRPFVSRRSKKSHKEPTTSSTGVSMLSNYFCTFP